MKGREAVWFYTSLFLCAVFLIALVISVTSAAAEPRARLIEGSLVRNEAVRSTIVHLALTRVIVCDEPQTLFAFASSTDHIYSFAKAIDGTVWNYDPGYHGSSSLQLDGGVKTGKQSYINPELGGLSEILSPSLAKELENRPYLLLLVEPDNAYNHSAAIVFYFFPDSDESAGFALVRLSQVR